MPSGDEEGFDDYFYTPNNAVEMSLTEESLA